MKPRKEDFVDGFHRTKECKTLEELFMSKPQVTHTVQTDRLRVQDDTYYKVTITVHYQYINITEFHPHHVKYVEDQTDKMLKTIHTRRLAPIVLAPDGKILDGVHRLHKEKTDDKT